MIFKILNLNLVKKISITTVVAISFFFLPFFNTSFAQNGSVCGGDYPSKAKCIEEKGDVDYCESICGAVIQTPSGPTPPPDPNSGGAVRPPASGAQPPAGGQTGAPSGQVSPSCATGTCGAGFCMQNGLCIPESPIKGSADSLVSSSSIMEVILKVLKMLLTIVGIIAVLLVIVGGFQYITAAGNEEQAEKGKKAIFNALIGLVVVILSYAIVNIIVKTLTNGLG